MEKVAYAGKNPLSRLRDGKLSLTAKVTAGLLAMVDAVRHILGEFEATAHDGRNDDAELLSELKRLQSDEEKSAATPPSDATPKSAPPSEIALYEPAPEKGWALLVERGGLSAQELAAALQEQPASRRYVPNPDRLGGLLVEPGIVNSDDVTRALRQPQGGDPRRLGEILVALGLAKTEEVQAAQQLLETRARETAMGDGARGVTLLDAVMSLVGELVLARNQCCNFPAPRRTRDFTRFRNA